MTGSSIIDITLANLFDRGTQLGAFPEVPLNALLASDKTGVNLTERNGFFGKQNTLEVLKVIAGVTLGALIEVLKNGAIEHGFEKTAVLKLNPL